MCIVKIERVERGEGGEVSEIALPAYATAGSAGMDLRAAVGCSLAPGARRLVPTGLRFAIPVGFEGQVRPRSGLAVKHGVTVLNAPGTIDSDYRGEVQVLLVNHGQDVFTIAAGDRIAQLVIAPVTVASLELGVFSAEDATARGAGGFGHTGSR